MRVGCTPVPPVFRNNLHTFRVPCWNKSQDNHAAWLCQIPGRNIIAAGASSGTDDGRLGPAGPNSLEPVNCHNKKCEKRLGRHRQIGPIALLTIRNGQSETCAFDALDQAALRAALAADVCEVKDRMAGASCWSKADGFADFVALRLRQP